jgi:hypothetical protein
MLLSGSIFIVVLWQNPAKNRNLLTEQYIYCIVKHPYKMGWEGAYAGIHRNASKGGM